MPEGNGKIRAEAPFREVRVQHVLHRFDRVSQGLEELVQEPLMARLHHTDLYFQGKGRVDQSRPVFAASVQGAAEHPGQRDGGERGGYIGRSLTYCCRAGSELGSAAVEPGPRCRFLSAGHRYTARVRLPNKTRGPFLRKCRKSAPYPDACAAGSRGRWPAGGSW
jgi:hypothetical protein